MKNARFGIYASALIIFIAIPHLVSAQSERWVYKYNSAPYGSDDLAYSVVYGTDGNIYAAGHSQGTGNNTDFTVVSLTSGGSERWVYKYNGTGNGTDEARKVVYGTDGNVYAVGYSGNAASGSADLILISLTSSGTQRWVYTWDASDDGGADDGYDLVFGNDGNIYAAGYSQSIDWPGWGRDPWITVLSVDTSGNPRWVYSFDTLPPNSQWGMMRSIVYGNDGNVYATGVIDQGMYLQYNYLAVISFTPAGAVRWNYLNSADNSCGNAIVYGNDGYLYAGGYLWYGGGVLENFGVVRVTTGGGQSWSYDYNGGYSDLCNSIAYGLDGNVYAAGRIGTAGNNSDYGVLSLNSGGGLRWLDSYNGPGNGYDCANAIVYGGDNMIYTAGTTQDTSPFYGRFTVMRYDQSGNRAGRYSYQGSSGDYAYAIAYGADSNLYIAGATIGNGYEFTVISLDTVITSGTDENTRHHPVSSALSYSVTSPFRNNITLQFAAERHHPVSIKLLNSCGDVVYAESFTNTPRLLTLNDAGIKQLPSGVYFIMVSSDDQELAKNKLVKIK